MRRREFITLLGGAAAWPIAARAQQAGKIVRIGFLGAASASGYARQVEEFRSGLRDLGYVEGTNIIIVYRWAEGNYARLPELAAALDSFRRGRDRYPWNTRSACCQTGNRYRSHSGDAWRPPGIGDRYELGSRWRKYHGAEFLQS